MRIYNTLTGRNEKLVKPKGRPLHLFVCGPTVYDYAHIGHARTYLIFDTFVRYLRASGFKVFYLQNITNIDDKIIDRARRERKNPLTLAKFFEKEYYRDMQKLGIKTVNVYARAADYIPEIVRQVQALIKRGYAYLIPGDGYYYDISRFKDYGKLSKRTAEQAEDAVSRIDASVQKRNQGDFCLWKFVKYNLNNPNDIQIKQINPNEKKIIENELFYKIKDLLLKIHNEMGRFRTKKQYGDAVESKFKSEKINYAREPSILVEGKLSEFAGFIIEDKIVLEIKVRPSITKEDCYRLQRYLESANLELGIIVNF